MWHGRGMDMHAFMDELEARFDEVRGRELEELIDELTDAERASVTLSARLAGADGLVNLSLRGGAWSWARCSTRRARGYCFAA